MTERETAVQRHDRMMREEREQAERLRTDRADPDIWKGNQDTVKIGFARDVLVTVPKGVAGKLKPVLERKDPLMAPVAMNGRVGTLKMMVDGKPLLELPVVALEEVSQASWFGRIWDSIRLWLQ